MAVLTETGAAARAAADPSLAGGRPARTVSAAARVARALLRALVASAVFVTAFTLWVTDVDFTNDHFQWISCGRQILAYGELPVRDFFDPGYFLQHFASAAAQLLFGDNLLGEAVLAVSSLALGVAITFLLAANASRSTLVGLVMAALVVSTAPRLYSYFKVLLLVAGLWLCWRYAERPSIRRLVVLALYTAFAFLFRHDHGVYVGLAAAVTVLATHLNARQALRRLAAFAVVSALPTLPFLVFLEVNGGVVEYVRSAVGWSGAAAQGPMRAEHPTFVLDTSAPLLTVAELPPRTAEVNVRWASAVGAERRAELERRYHLTIPERPGSDSRSRTWQYKLVDLSEANIAALVRDRSVEDTDGIDRTTFRANRLTDEPLSVSLQRAVPPLTLRIVPGLVQSANAVPWLYYLFVSLPAIAVVVLAFRYRMADGRSSEIPKVLSAAILCVVAHYALLRFPLGYRLADVVAPTTVLGAWLALVC